MYETLLRLWKDGKLTESMMDNAVVKGWITEEQKVEVMSQQTCVTQGEELNSEDEILVSKNDNGTFNGVVDDKIKLGEEIKSEIIEQIINALQQSKRS